MADDTPLQTTLKAMVKPLPLLVAAGAVAAGLLSGTWAWAVPGGMLYLFLVYLMGPLAWKARQVSLELGLDLKDAPPGLRRWNSSLNEALRQVERDLARADRHTARMLAPVRAEVKELGTDIRRLIRRAHAIHRYLQQTNLAATQSRLAQLQGQIANTSDAFSRQQLTEAAEALQRQVQNCEQLRVLLGRTEATLENMQASLQSIGSSVVKITAGGRSEAQIVRDSSLERVSSARSTVAALEEVLERVELA
ncbi:MAG: hypothetical protein HPY69_18785 [Armatimonadetes bacterium]|nr:hypothetical protein [Armatimonadota bacterium]